MAQKRYFNRKGTYSIKGAKEWQKNQVRSKKAHWTCSSQIIVLIELKKGCWNRSISRALKWAVNSHLIIEKGTVGKRMKHYHTTSVTSVTIASEIFTFFKISKSCQLKPNSWKEHSRKATEAFLPRVSLGSHECYGKRVLPKRWYFSGFKMVFQQATVKSHLIIEK